MKPEIADGLLAAWNRKLYLWFTQYNEEYAGGVCGAPVIVLGSGCRQLGSWDPVLRRITISLEHVRRDPWLEVMDTLRHEMAHPVRPRGVRGRRTTPWPGIPARLRDPALLPSRHLGFSR